MLSVADEYMPGPEILDLILGVQVHAGYKDEKVTIFEALPPDEARHITLEPFDLGCLEVAVLEDGETRRLAPDEARVVLSDPGRWVNAGRPDGPAFCELSLTQIGKELFAQACERFGDEHDRRYEQVHELIEEFQRQEPEFWRQHKNWFEDLSRWF